MPTAYAFATNADEDGQASNVGLPNKTILTPHCGQIAGGMKYQEFLEFQVAQLPAPVGSVGACRFTVAMGADNSTTDFTVEVYEYDWGGTLEAEDFRADADLAALYAAGKLIASTSTAGWTANQRRELTLTAYGESRIGQLFTSGGTLRVVLASDRQRQSIAASGNEYVDITTASHADPYKPYISQAYENAAAGVILQFDMANFGYGSTNAGPVTFSRTSTLIKHGNFAAAEAAWYFEIVAKNSDGADRTVSLYDATNDQVVASITVPAGATSETRYRSAAFTPNGSDVVYRLRNPQTTSANQVIVWASRLIWKAKGATKCDVPLGMIGGYAWPYSIQYTEADSTTIPAFSTTATSYDTASIMRRSGPRLRKSHYRTPKSCRLDVVMCTASGGTAKARLYDQDAAAQVGSLELSTTNDAAPYAVASGAIDWADIPSDHHLSVQLKNDTAGKTTYFFRAQLSVHLAPVQEVDAIISALVGWGGTSSSYIHTWGLSLIETDGYGGNLVGLATIGYCTSTPYGVQARVGPLENIGRQSYSDSGSQSLYDVVGLYTTSPTGGWSYDLDTDVATLAGQERVVVYSKNPTGGDDGWVGNSWWLVNYGNPGIEWAGVAVQINGGAASTDDNDVTLTLAGTADGSAPDQVAFSDNGTDWSAWEAYHASRAYQLAPQTAYPSQTRTVWARYRVQKDSEWYESDPVSDSITLAVEWTSAIVIVNRDAEQTYSRDVSVRFRAYSSAQDPIGDGIHAKLVRRYRIRDAAGSWSAWGTAAPAGDGWTTVPLQLPGDGDRVVEVEWEDDDGNQWTASDGITVMPTGVLIDNAPPPQDITNWRLLIGGRDFIDDVEAPPGFDHGQHGPGELHATLPVEDPLRPFANELRGGADVELWDGTLLLWDGLLKPLAPVSSDAPALELTAAGALDSAKQDEGVLYTVVDADPGNWRVSQKSSKAYNMDREGRIRIEHEKGRGVTSGKGAAIWYWANNGRRPQIIDHLLFTGYDIDVDANNWYARVQVAASPWHSWTTVKEWNNEAHVSASGTIRVPATAGQSFAEAGYDDVYAVKVLLVSGSTLTAAESVNDRFVILKRPQVFFIDDEPRVDQVQASVAELLGYPVETEAVGSALKHVAWREEQTTWAQIMEDAAARYAGEVEWLWHDGTFLTRPKPTAPEYRHRWYVVDTRQVDWGVVTDEEARKDFVEVTYKIAEDATYPAGTIRTLYRPSTPASPFARVAPLDMTEQGPMTTAQAQDAGDQWLAWNNSQAKVGPIAGFGGYIRTIDGQWVAACHARTGDWIHARDLADQTPLYITGVDVPEPDNVTLHVGGAELEYRYTKRVFRRPRPRRPELGQGGRRPRPRRR